MGDDKSNPGTPLDPAGMIHAGWVSLHEMYQGARQAASRTPPACLIIAGTLVINSKAGEDG